MKKLIFIAVLALFSSGIFAQTTSVSLDDLKSLEGNWRGTIEYFESKKIQKNLVLQTELICQIKKNVLVMKFKYYDKNGEFTRKTEKLIISESGTTIKDNVIWQVLEIVKDGKKGDIELAMKSVNNKEAIAMRKTISIQDGKLSISKDEILGERGEYNSLYSFNFEKLDHKLYR